MVDLSAEMVPLLASFRPAPAGQGRVIQFAAARSGAGVSTFAREFARAAAAQARRPVWLIDLDLAAPGQAEALKAQARRYGGLGQAASASPDGTAFFAVQPALRAADGQAVPDGRYLEGRRVGNGRLWVARFRREALRGKQQARLLPSGDYWRTMRRFAEWVVLDAPAADRSDAAVTAAPFVDATVLVVSADDPDTKGPAALRSAIEQAGGRCAGLVFNRARIETPRFLKRMLG
ncbi:MAG TPA: sugar kinase [Caulobacteraceae bacterium]|jgi:Mrp family chromosome partitioning ATPase